MERIARELNWQRSFAKWAVPFFTAPKVIPSLYGKASTETAGEIAFITLPASTVRFPINSPTVQLHNISTTLTDRWPTDVRIMASSLEWQVPTVSEQEIAGDILNLMNLLRWLWSLCLIVDFRCYTYDDYIDDNTEEHATGHRTSSEEVSVSSGSLICAGLQCKRILVVTRSVCSSRNL